MAIKQTLVILVSCALVACSTTRYERQLNRASKQILKKKEQIKEIAAKFPELTIEDTVRTIVPPQRIDTFAVITVDTSMVDSLRQLLGERLDSVVFEEVVRLIPAICDIRPVEFETDTLSLRAWIQEGKIRFDFRLKEFEVKQTVDTIQPLRIQATEKSKRLIARWKTVAFVFIGLFLLSAFGFFMLARRK